MRINTRKSARRKRGQPNATSRIYFSRTVNHGGAAIDLRIGCRCKSHVPASWARSVQTPPPGIGRFDAEFAAEPAETAESNPNGLNRVLIAGVDAGYAFDPLPANSFHLLCFQSQ
ncbi:MAG: hypothetical protein QGH25_10140 [Candidatus Latescibacteria bacterium]|jgi:hypothetical protein|nr:hypothetical protein [Candidatus Latescibacterota bacterium]